MRGNMRAFYRLLGERSPGGTLVERDGVLGAIVPSCPNQSVVNGVVYEDVAALKAMRNELEAAYRRAGVRCWRVWVPEGDSSLGEWLRESGHRFSASPRAMTLDLTDAELDVSDELDWERTGDVCAIAALNEQAYGLPAGEFAQALTALAGGSVELYLARERGEAAACVAAVEEDGDCGIYCVATRPASRGRGLATGLMRPALTAARQRGCRSSSLQSSKSGLGVYQQLGYRDVCAIGTWERTLVIGPDLAQPAKDDFGVEDAGDPVPRPHRTEHPPGSFPAGAATRDLCFRAGRAGELTLDLQRIACDVLEARAFGIAGEDSLTRARPMADPPPATPLRAIPL
jgi:GNAT superfamily N-acetyltransferase